MSSPHSPVIDYPALLDDVIDGAALPDRLQKQTANVLSDLNSEFTHALGDTPITTISSEVKAIITTYIDNSNKSKDSYTSDTQNLTVFGGALLVALRRHNIPITADEITDLINQNGDATTLVTRLSGTITADYTDSTENNITLRTDSRTYQFRLESPNGTAPREHTITRILNGHKTTHTENIRELTEYISNNTIQRKQVMRSKRELDAINSELNPAPDPEAFVTRYADELHIHTNAKTRAITLTDVFSESSSRNPAVVSAAALWLAVQHTRNHR